MFNLLLLLGAGITTGIGASYILDKISNDLEFCKNSEKTKVLKKYNIDLTNKTCSVCGREITQENLGMIIPYNGDTYFICNEEKCLTLKDVVIGME